MSRKRTASDQLTGGTKDVNPQYLSGTITLSAANTATEVTLGTPIVRVGPQTGGKSIIMELIKLWVELPQLDLDNAAATNRSLVFSMSTSSSGATPAIVQLSNSRGLAFIAEEVRNAFTAAGTGLLWMNSDPHCWDFTDGAGHGILVATDNIFIQANSVGLTAAATWNWKLSYRFKEVSLVEYIGIVQSQQ